MPIHLMHVQGPPSVAETSGVRETQRGRRELVSMHPVTHCCCYNLYSSSDPSGKHDPAKNLSDCIESFQYFKSDMSRKAKISLDERKQ